MLCRQYFNRICSNFCDEERKEIVIHIIGKRRSIRIYHLNETRNGEKRKKSFLFLHPITPDLFKPVFLKKEKENKITQTTKKINQPYTWYFDRFKRVTRIFFRRKDVVVRVVKNGFICT